MIKSVCLFILAYIVFCSVSLADEYTELIAYRDSLQQQIDAVDSEIARCQKSLKTWKTTTIVGGIGAVASGIGIIAQSNQIKENKKVLDTMSSDAKDADATLDFIQKVNK